MISLANEPRLMLIHEGTRCRPHGSDRSIKVECLCYHEFFGWCVLTYDGERSAWYMRGEEIYSEQLIHAAWVLPEASDLVTIKPKVRKKHAKIILAKKRKGVAK